MLRTKQWAFALEICLSDLLFHLVSSPVSIIVLLLYTTYTYLYVNSKLTILISFIDNIDSHTDKCKRNYAQYTKCLLPLIQQPCG